MSAKAFKKMQVGEYMPDNSPDAVMERVGKIQFEMKPRRGQKMVMMHPEDHGFFGNLSDKRGTRIFAGLAPAGGMFMGMPIATNPRVPKGKAWVGEIEQVVDLCQGVDTKEL